MRILTKEKMMHGFPEWLGWLIEYWPVALAMIVFSAVWVVGAVVFLIKGWTFKIAAIWPLFLLFYNGPQ